jgi:hypothetical protein
MDVHQQAQSTRGGQVDEIPAEAERLLALATELGEPVEVTAARQLIIYRNSLSETRQAMAEAMRDGSF